MIWQGDGSETNIHKKSIKIKLEVVKNENCSNV